MSNSRYLTIMKNKVFVEDIYGTEVFLSKNKVLTIDEFYRIAQSFFETQARPDFIEWEKI